MKSPGRLNNYMPKLTANKLIGNWGTLLLPIMHDDEIDYYLLQEEIDYLISARINGIYSNGTAGEFYNVTEYEFDKISELLATKCRSADMPYQIGVSHMSPIISLERLKRSKYLDPQAFQVILPDWIISNSEERVSFLRKMEETAAPIPLVLYNPPHAKHVLTPLDFKELSDKIPGLIGIKVGDGDSNWYAEMRRCSSALSVFVPGHHLATGFKENVAAGSYSNIACLSPRGSKEWYDLMSKDITEALQIEKRILQFFYQCILPFSNSGYCDPALDKFLAAVGGWAQIGTRLRWPYRGINENEVTDVRRIAQRILPEFFNVCA